MNTWKTQSVKEFLTEQLSQVYPSLHQISPCQEGTDLMEDLLVLASPDQLWKMLGLPFCIILFFLSLRLFSSLLHQHKTRHLLSLNAISWLAMADASIHNIRIKVFSIRHDRVVEFKSTFKWKLLYNNITGFFVLVLRRRLIQSVESDIALTAIT